MPHVMIAKDRPIRRRTLLSVLVMLSALVHCLDGTTSVLAEGKKPKGGAKSAATQPAVANPDGLPAPVVEVRDALLAAARSGRIEELRGVLDLNEMKPELAAEPVADPVSFWKRASADGEGREVLAVVWTLLEGSHAVLRLGKDIENNRIYVWPALAEKPLVALSPAEEVELLRLVPAPVAAAMKSSGRYSGWRLAIGADGTWHSLRKVP